MPAKSESCKPVKAQRRLLDELDASAQHEQKTPVPRLPWHRAFGDSGNHSDGITFLLTRVASHPRDWQWFVGRCGRGQEPDLPRDGKVNPNRVITVKEAHDGRRAFQLLLWLVSFVALVIAVPMLAQFFVGSLGLWAHSLAYMVATLLVGSIAVVLAYLLQWAYDAWACLRRSEHVRAAHTLSALSQHPALKRWMVFKEDVMNCFRGLVPVYAHQIQGRVVKAVQPVATYLEACEDLDVYESAHEPLVHGVTLSHVRWEAFETYLETVQAHEKTSWSVASASRLMALWVRACAASRVAAVPRLLQHQAALRQLLQLWVGAWGVPEDSHLDAAHETTLCLAFAALNGSSCDNLQAMRAAVNAFTLTSKGAVPMHQRSWYLHVLSAQLQSHLDRLNMHDHRLYFQAGAHVKHGYESFAVSNASPLRNVGARCVLLPDPDNKAATLQIRALQSSLQRFFGHLDDDSAWWLCCALEAKMRLPVALRGVSIDIASTVFLIWRAKQQDGRWLYQTVLPSPSRWSPNPWREWRSPWRWWQERQHWLACRGRMQGAVHVYLASTRAQVASEPPLAELPTDARTLRGPLYFESTYREQKNWRLWLAGVLWFCLMVGLVVAYGFFCLHLHWPLMAGSLGTWVVKDAIWAMVGLGLFMLWLLGPLAYGWGIRPAMKRGLWASQAKQHGHAKAWRDWRASRKACDLWAKRGVQWHVGSDSDVVGEAMRRFRSDYTAGKRWIQWLAVSALLALACVLTVAVCVVLVKALIPVLAGSFGAMLIQHMTWVLLSVAIMSQCLLWHTLWLLLIKPLSKRWYADAHHLLGKAGGVPWARYWVELAGLPDDRLHEHMRACCSDTTRHATSQSLYLRPTDYLAHLIFYHALLQGWGSGDQLNMADQLQAWWQLFAEVWDADQQRAIISDLWDMCRRVQALSNDALQRACLGGSDARQKASDLALALLDHCAEAPDKLGESQHGLIRRLVSEVTVIACQGQSLDEHFPEVPQSVPQGPA